MGRRPARSAADPTEALLEEAEALQQRAERRQSEPTAAIAAYEQAAAKFERAARGSAGSSPAADAAARAAFGMGESLQGWADGLMAAAALIPDAPQAPVQEAAAKSQASGLLERAVHAFQQVREMDGSPRPDAAVATGNALSTAAELAPGPSVAANLLAGACGAYEAALAAEDDAMTHSNLADALVARAERLCDSGEAAAGASLYLRAMAEYETSCALSSSEQGDDLPGLLHNWGVGLHSLGTHAAAGSPEAAAALAEAAQRLADSAAFSRADPAPLNALGDVRMAQAERAAGPAAAAAAKAAIDEGYSQALAIDGGNADALVGTAEAHTFLGGQLRDNGNAAGAVQHFSIAAQAYQAALSQPKPLGLFAERCDVRYNFACAAAQCRRGAEAAVALGALLACCHVSEAELAADADLAVAMRDEAFLQLLRGGG